MAKEIYKNRKFSFELECSNEGVNRIITILQQTLDSYIFDYHKLKVKTKGSMKQ